MNRRKILGPADRPIGIYSNPLKDINHAAAFKFIEYLKAIGMKAVFAREAGDTGFPCPVGIETVSLEKLFGISGLIVVFGGDGTMLRAINGAAPLKIPVLGVNMGNVGFLTETDAGGLEAAAKALKDGRFEIDERSMLEIRVSRGAADLSAAAYLALNEIAVRESALKIARVHVSIDGSPVCEYSADGVLVATPTGSTAYSLSAGGPILAPDVNALIITPLNPHALHCRSFVVSDSSKIEIRTYGKDKLQIIADGAYKTTIEPDQSFSVVKASIKARFIKTESLSFYNKLWHKLGRTGLYRD